MLKIKELCKTKGISMAELAEKIGITPSALSQSISGNPNLDRLKQIAEALDIPITRLFSDNKITGFIKANDEIFEVNSILDIKELLVKIK